MNQLKRIGLFLVLLTNTLFFQNVANAEKADKIGETEQQAGFTIKAELPENQIDPAKGYFHLLVGKDHEQKIKIKIYNTTNKEQTYTVKVNVAKTNKNGLIVYDDLDTPLDTSLKLPITEVVRPDSETVTVAAANEGEAILTIQLKNQAFEGILLGGVHVEVKESEETENTEGMSVANRYSYISGLILTQDQDTPVFGETELTLLKINPSVHYGSKVIEAHIQNPHPETMDSVNIQGQITKKGSNKVIAEQELNKARIAPNSVLPFQIDWGKEIISPGKYVFEGSAKTGDKVWKFKKAFTISAEKAEKMNKQAIVKFILPDWWKQGVLICTIITVLLLFFLVYRTIRRGK